MYCSIVIVVVDTNLKFWFCAPFLQQNKTNLYWQWKFSLVICKKNETNLAPCASPPGSDVSVYLPDTSMGSSSGNKCTCAFSAAVNRHFGYDAGLFYEDEVEITGYRHDRYDVRKPPLAKPGLAKPNGDNSYQEDMTPRVSFIKSWERFD